MPPFANTCSDHAAIPLEGEADLLALALADHREGRLASAEALYGQLLVLQPENFSALQLLAALTAQRGRPDDALPLFERALSIEPHHAVTLNNFGNALLALHRRIDALARYDRALEVEPGYADAHFNRGNALLALARHAEAVASYDHALEMESGHVEALYNRGIALADMDQPAAALRAFDDVLVLRPAHVPAHQNRGCALQDLGRHAAALANYDRALGIAPDSVALHVNRALLLLLLGEFRRGWEEHEWRLRDPQLSLPPHHLPRWRGEPLSGRTILLRAEQGLGDTLQFVRYARVLQQQGARVIVCCQPSLLTLLRRCEGIDAIVTESDPLPHVDCWAPLMSVPATLGTDLHTIPGQCGYLSADPELMTKWAERLAAFPGFRVAIAWQGNPTHTGDARRSLPLGAFAALARVPGVRLIALQLGQGLAQLTADASGLNVIQFDDLDATHGAFMDSAAILRTVDLVVCCDTSLAHLAGALEVPVWLALAAQADWRWLLDRDDSPWYPSLRIVRQRTPGDWSHVFQTIAGVLHNRVGA